MVGDGHAMGVAAEILQDILDHPVLPVEWPQPGSEDLGICQKLQVGLEVELSILKSSLESVDEFTAKDFGQHCLGEEVFLSGANPAAVIRRETTGGNDAVDMRMDAELLTPGV